MSIIDTTAPATEGNTVRYETVDAREVRIETNVRTAPRLDKDFLASIKRHGVIIPVLAYTGDDGAVIVRDGQLRILAANETERYTVPAIILPSNDENTIRIMQQIIANEFHHELTEGDYAGAYKQLALDGMTPTVIAKELSHTVARVKAGIAVADNELASKAVAEFELDFGQALVLAEFEDDKDALGKLRGIAKKNPHNFDHYAQQLRDERDRHKKMQTAVEDYTAKGVTITDAPDQWNSRSTTAYLHQLQDANGKQLTEKNYAGNPGYAVCISEGYDGVKIGHVVIDWKQHGLRRINDNGVVSGAWTEEQKAERRTLIANNKAWDSAEKVRRTWLANLLSRKSLPKDAAVFTAITFAEFTFEVGHAIQDHHSLAHTLLGLEYQYGRRNKLVALIEATPTKAATVSFALALGALESSTSKNTWRSPGSVAVAYFTALKGWGYTLSDVENLVLGIKPEAEATENPTEAASGPIEPEQEAAATDSEAPSTEGTTEPDSEVATSDDAEPESEIEPEGTYSDFEDDAFESEFDAA
jgi:ParB family chromosome partitioning protein